MPPKPEPAQKNAKAKSNPVAPKPGVTENPKVIDSAKTLAEKKKASSKLAPQKKLTKEEIKKLEDDKKRQEEENKKNEHIAGLKAKALAIELQGNFKVGDKKEITGTIQVLKKDYTSTSTLSILIKKDEKNNHLYALQDAINELSIIFSTEYFSTLLKNNKEANQQLHANGKELMMDLVPPVADLNQLWDLLEKEKLTVSNSPDNKETPDLVALEHETTFSLRENIPATSIKWSGKFTPDPELVAKLENIEAKKGKANIGFALSTPLMEMREVFTQFFDPAVYPFLLHLESIQMKISHNTKVSYPFIEVKAFIDDLTNKMPKDSDIRKIADVAHQIAKKKPTDYTILSAIADILKCCALMGISHNPFIAYILATTIHESLNYTRNEEDKYSDQLKCKLYEPVFFKGNKLVNETSGTQLTPEYTFLKKSLSITLKIINLLEPIFPFEIKESTSANKEAKPGTDKKDVNPSKGEDKSKEQSPPAKTEENNKVANPPKEEDKSKEQPASVKSEADDKKDKSNGLENKEKTKVETPISKGNRQLPSSASSEVAKAIDALTNDVFKTKNITLKEGDKKITVQMILEKMLVGTSTVNEVLALAQTFFAFAIEEVDDEQNQANLIHIRGSDKNFYQALGLHIVSSDKKKRPHRLGFIEGLDEDVSKLIKPHLEKFKKYMEENIKKAIEPSEAEATLFLELCFYPSILAHLVIRIHKAQGLGNTKKNDGENFKGRGLVQLTGRVNYQKFSNYFFKHSDEVSHVLKDLGYDISKIQIKTDDKKSTIPEDLFISDPELAKDFKISAVVTIAGMSKVGFAGADFVLSTYLDSPNPNLEAYKKARLIVNGRDKNKEIAEHAIKFAAALKK